MRKTLVSNLVDCPTLGAPALETQTNPLLDNFEGMALTTPPLPLGFQGVTMISDDNFIAAQHTRPLNLVLRLPHSSPRPFVRFGHTRHRPLAR